MILFTEESKRNGADIKRFFVEPLRITLFTFLIALALGITNCSSQPKTNRSLIDSARSGVSNTSSSSSETSSSTSSIITNSTNSSSSTHKSSKNQTSTKTSSNTVTSGTNTNTDTTNT